MLRISTWCLSDGMELSQHLYQNSSWRNSDLLRFIQQKSILLPSLRMGNERTDDTILQCFFYFCPNSLWVHHACTSVYFHRCWGKDQLHLLINGGFSIFCSATQQMPFQWEIVDLSRWSSRVLRSDVDLICIWFFHLNSRRTPCISRKGTLDRKFPYFLPTLPAKDCAVWWRQWESSSLC